MALCLALLLQADLDAQVDQAVRQFQAAAEAEQAFGLLLAQLEGLGAAAATPIARRLAADLRDGMASAFAPALIDVLEGRPEALVPLQAAFRDAATPVAGRIELANALSQLDDAASWRDGVAAIAADPQVALGDRLRAFSVLMPIDESRAVAGLRSLVATLAERPAEEQVRVAEYLSGPGPSDLLLEVARDPRLAPAAREAAAQALLRRGVPERGVRILDEPAASLVEVAERAEPPAFPPPPRRKEEEIPAATGTMALGVAIIVLVAALLAIQRKG